jgi:hypothetical protein
MSNPKPYIFTNETRGHRLPLSTAEPTVNYLVCVPLSWREMLKTIGPAKVRKRLDSLIRSYIKTRAAVGNVDETRVAVENLSAPIIEPASIQGSGRDEPGPSMPTNNIGPVITLG